MPGTQVIEHHSSNGDGVSPGADDCILGYKIRIWIAMSYYFSLLVDCAVLREPSGLVPGTLGH